MKISYPIATLDFEASSLLRGSYPIEVGVATWGGPGHPVEVRSTLIEPAPEWVRDGVWTEESQAVHGIAPARLAGAPDARSTMRTLNRILSATAGRIALCDGGEHDQYWLDRLCWAADVARRFRLDSFGRYIDGLDEDQRTRANGFRFTGEYAHRAGEDALVHMDAITAAAGERPDVSRPEWE